VYVVRYLTCADLATGLKVTLSLSDMIGTGAPRRRANGASPMTTIDFTDSDAPAALRFERRRAERHAIHGVATAFVLGGDRFGEMHHLQLVDNSSAGIGARCDTVIDPGTMVTLGFSVHGYTARRGTVVRCLPCGDGYRLAIRFEQRMAA
jgi:hypothetical protein